MCIMWQVTWEADSRRPRHSGEPSTTKNSSSSRARKTGAQLWDNPEERENGAKCAEKNPSSHRTAESNLSLLQTGMSTISGDELILRHFQQRDCVAAYSQGRPHLVDELQQQGQRPLCQSTATVGPSQF